MVLRKLNSMPITLRVEDVPAFLNAARAVGWSAVDSGERVTNDDGIDREAVVVLRVPVEDEAPRPVAGEA